jgi:hypothetical protein
MPLVGVGEGMDFGASEAWRGEIVVIEDEAEAPRERGGARRAARLCGRDGVCQFVGER